MEKKQGCEQQKNSSSTSNNTPPSSSSWTRNGENNNNEPSEEDSSMDDYCVYTYKGDSRRSERLADLPSSFFEFCSPSSAVEGLSPLSIQGQERNYAHGGDSAVGMSSSSACLRTLTNGSTTNSFRDGGGNNNELYSPDMDFLEMDFDPGGTGESCDNLDDIHDDSEPELYSESQPREEILRMLTSQNIRSPSSNICPSPGTSNPGLNTTATVNSEIPVPLFNSEQKSSTKEDEQPCCSKTLKVSTNQNGDTVPSFPSSSMLSIRLVKSNTLPDMGSSSRIKSLGEFPVTTRSAMVVSNSAPLIRQTSSESSTKESIELEVNGAMIWTWEEAREKSIRQIGSSACGATAVLNVMTALGRTDITPATANSCVGTRLRANDADLPEYLFSRSHAGATHVDLISGIDRVSNGQVYGRFFQPSRNFSSSTLIKWLLHWICQGAVPVFTLNMQIQPPGTDEIPDAWHHQMVFGVAPEGVCLNNPVELQPYSTLLPQLTSASVLLVRRQDVILRKGPRTDLRKLVRNSDPRWNELNVLGQVSNMFLEEMPVFNGSTVAKRVRSTHISIPAAYKAGISLFVQRDAPICQLLQKAEEL